MKKQTAVDWFQEQIIKIVCGTCELSEIEIFEQAKAIEKEQIMDANEEGFHSGQSMAHNGTCCFESPKDYYNKTYKNTEE